VPVEGGEERFVKFTLHEAHDYMASCAVAGTTASGAKISPLGAVFNWLNPAYLLPKGDQSVGCTPFAVKSWAGDTLRALSLRWDKEFPGRNKVQALRDLNSHLKEVGEDAPLATGTDLLVMMSANANDLLTQVRGGGEGPKRQEPSPAQPSPLAPLTSHRFVPLLRR